MQALTANVLKHQAEPAKTDKRVVLGLDEFQRSFPTGTAFFAVCTGPYCVSFRQAQCFECGQLSLVRQYRVKIAALESLQVLALDDQERAQLGQMDSIAQSMYVIYAQVWVTSRDPSDSLALASIHSTLPKWVLESTARIINDSMVSSTVPFAKLSFVKSELGRKTLVHVCPGCQDTLPGYHECDANAEQHPKTLLDASGQPLLYSWPVVVSALAQA